MRKVPFKNYIYLILIVLVFGFAVYAVGNIYKQSKRVESDFYKFSNTITNKDFEVYITEYPNSIIYIYDKYSTDYKEFEKELQEKIESLYLKNNFVYFDKRELNKKIINSMKENYNTELEYKSKPIIIIILDKEVVNVINVDESTTIESLNLEVFE